MNYACVTVQYVQWVCCGQFLPWWWISCPPCYLLNVKTFRTLLFACLLILLSRQFCISYEIIKINLHISCFASISTFCSRHFGCAPKSLCPFRISSAEPLARPSFMAPATEWLHVRAPFGKEHQEQAKSPVSCVSALSCHESLLSSGEIMDVNDAFVQLILLFCWTQINSSLPQPFSQHRYTY